MFRFRQGNFGVAVSTIMDEEGDLTLLIGPDIDGNKPTSFLVCSRSVARASQSFKAMLDHRFPKSQTASPVTEARVIKLPNDCPVAAKVILNIIHGRIAAVPNTLPSLSALHCVMVFAEKWDTTALVLPWVQHWLSSLLPLNAQHWVTYWGVAVLLQLGAKGPLRELVDRIVCSAAVNRTELLLNGSPLFPVFEHTCALTLEPGGFTSKNMSRNPGLRLCQAYSPNCDS